MQKRRAMEPPSVRKRRIEAAAAVAEATGKIEKILKAVYMLNNGIPFDEDMKEFVIEALINSSPKLPKPKPVTKRY